MVKVNFTHNPTISKGTVFVLIMHNAMVYTIYPMIVSELNHNRTAFYLLFQRTEYGPEGMDVPA